MLRILESQAPAKQTATDTINTLSSRLSTATLLEDRRAAILGLRSFAKQYPASVASGALRDLTAALRRDGEDSDTTKVVLETLLMLFEPDEQSPEASEEITLWLADEFSQRQDNITALLDLLETAEFYLRLYSLQILSHVTAARPQRAQEVVLTAPLGVSRITTVLDDRREAVRNEALLLLVSLTPTNAELQKVVAFENAFDRVFALIESEGGLTHGSTVVQDCLSLLANLLNLNVSNQSYFREIGSVQKVAKLLADVIKEEESAEGVSDWLRTQRDINVWGTLRVIQLFVVHGSQGTHLSQSSFWQNRVLLRILQIAFHQSFGTNVRAKSLDVCGDIIRNNAVLQEQFGDLAVPLFKPRSANVNGTTNPDTKRGVNGRGSGPTTPMPTEHMNVIEALLKLTLEPAPLNLFDVRLAASKCIQSFMEGHTGIRSHVLRRAIEGHQSGDDAIPNILTVLLEPSGTRSNSDPYQVWMASVLLLHILHEDPETKSMALKVTEGNADDGEEVVTFVQSLTSNIVAGVQHVEDERALLGHLMLLCTWLFEDPDAVNDFLGEGSNVNGLAAAVKVASPTMPLAAGLCSLLLGIIYEFSTKDSPIPRATLHDVLSKSLSREVYIDRLTRLRESPFVRDFEVMPINGDGPLPEVYFDKTFVDFLKDNFSRLLRAIDRDPGLEISFVANGVEKGVSRELVDSLRAEAEEHKRLIETSQSEVVQLRQKLEQEELEHRRTRDSTSVELGRIKQINDSLQRHHEDETQQLQRHMQQRSDAQSRAHESALAQLRREHLAAVEEMTSKHAAEKNYLEQRTSGHERELRRLQEKLVKQHAEELESATSELIQEAQRLRSEIQTLQSQKEEVKAKLARQDEENQQEMQKLRKEYDQKISETQARERQAIESSSSKEAEFHKLDVRLKDIQTELAEAKKSTKAAEERAAKADAATSDVNKKLASSETKAKKAEDLARSTTEKLKAIEKKFTEAESSLKTTQTDLKTTKDQLKKLQAESKNKKTPDSTKSASSEKDRKALDAAQVKAQSLEKDLAEARSQADKAKEVQGELDDLLVVFADLEAKRAGDKKRLKDLGEEVSEDEDEDEDTDDADNADEEEEDEVD